MVLCQNVGWDYVFFYVLWLLWWREFWCQLFLFWMWCVIDDVLDGLWGFVCRFGVGMVPGFGGHVGV